MVTPTGARWTFARLGRTRQEVARLEALKVLSADEAARLRDVIDTRERQLEPDLPSESSAAAFSFYRLVSECVAAGDTDHVSNRLARRLESLYVDRRPRLVETFGPLLPPEVSPTASAPEPAASPAASAAQAASWPPAPAVVPRAVATAPEPAPEPAEDHALAAGWSLARFLETVNIGWGMFAASLLIIGCSIALVVTLWRSEVPLVRYLTFLGVTLGLNAAGQFAVRRLHLAITGGTLLALSLALMPLNLIASELFGGVGGRAIPLPMSIAIWIGLSLVAWLGFRAVHARSAGAAGVGFGALIGLQLAVAAFGEPGDFTGVVPAWAGTFVLLGVLPLLARRLRGAGAGESVGENVGDSDTPTALRLVFAGGLLLFAHLLLWARVHADSAAAVAFAGIAPVVVVHLLAILWLARELGRRAAEGEWCRRVAVMLATFAHFALPLVVALVALSDGGRVLPTALAALVAYAVVAGWHRSEWAVGGAGLAAVLAAWAALAHLHQAPGEVFSWLPVQLPVFAFRLLPLVAILLIAAEAAARRRKAPGDFAARTAGVLAAYGVFAAAGLLAGAALDLEWLGRGVVALGAFALLMTAVARRSVYAYATLVAAPLALALGPFGLREAISNGALDLALAGFALAYTAAAFALRRAHGGIARTFAPACEPVALALVPAILAMGIVRATDWLAVPAAVAAVAVCLVFAAARGWRRLGYAAGAAYAIAVAQAIHHALAPWPATSPAAAVWLLVAAVLPLGYALLAGRRAGVAGAATFTRPAVIWATVLVWAQLVVYGVAPITTVSALAAVGSAAALFALAALRRRDEWTWMGIVFLGFGAFFTLHRFDPFGIDAAGGGLLISRWVALAPLAHAVALLGMAALLRHGWRRRVFVHPLVVASMIGSLLAFTFLLFDWNPPAKVWTLALVLAAISAVHFRLTRSWVFLAAIPLLGWIATTAFAYDLLPSGWSQWSDRLLATLLVVGTVVVAAGAIALERLLTAHAARPAGVWLRGVSLLALRIVFSAAAMSVLIAEALFAISAADHGSAMRGGLPVWPGAHLAGLLVLIGAGLVSIRGAGKPRFRITLGLAGGVAVLWPICYMQGLAAARYASVALAAYACGWLVFTLVEPLRGRLAGWCRVVEGCTDVFWFRAKSGWIITVFALAALGTALARPDDPATVVTGAIFAVATLAVAAAGRRAGWLVVAIVSTSLTAAAALHRLLPEPPIEGNTLYPDALFPFAVLFAVLGAVWYGLRVVGKRRAATGRVPRLVPRVLGVAALVSSLIALGLLALFVTPALEIEPTEIRFEYVAGAVLLALITIAYLLIAAREQQPALVYLGEACIAGIFLYVRVTHPWIYRLHFFRRLWPLTLVAIAYGATALEQLLSRIPAGRIYAGPLRYTGLLLPLGPLAGVWFRPEVDSVAITSMGAIAAFYAWIAYLHRSTVFAYVSTAIANATMMVWAWRLGWDFHVHPQIFLWPLGLSLIAVAQVQRRRLPDAVVQALRGIGACIIYGSMATAIFTDLRHQTLEMSLLALASVAGIGAGIGFKIRAFLYAGFGFLIFDVVYMVFRAGREDTWIWWISGIALGVTVLFAFAFFEKRRQDVERWVGKLKQWD